MVRVTRLTEQDIPALRALGSGRPMWRELIPQQFRSSFGAVFGATDVRGRLLGALWLQMGGDWGDILDVIVSPDARRQGCGRALLERAMEAASAQGCIGVTLEVAHDNEAALQLYQSAGFEEVHRRPGYYRDAAGAKDALVLSLRFAAPPA